MKRVLALVLALLMVVPFVACGSEEAYNSSKKAFQKTTQAYLMINEYSKDVYEAWRLGIHEIDDYNGESELADLALELGLELDDLKAAIASLLEQQNYYPAGYYDSNGDLVNESDRDNYYDGSDYYDYDDDIDYDKLYYYHKGDWALLQERYGGSFFSACVSVVAETYVVNGTVKEISDLLIEAKDEMKKLSNEHADYTHYENLKEYYSNTLAFFDFCQDPEGSFEQVVETFNNYRNTARTCFFDLNYIFEDSINGMHTEEEDIEDEI